jgi:predicted ATPase/class 3 adenylate cyclase
VTFLFSDIEGSTRLWERAPEQMRAAVERHDEILRQAIEACGGYVFATGGDGFAVAFQRGASACEAAIKSQLELATESWLDGAEIRVRMGIHTGEVTERAGDYFGAAVNRAARLMGIAHGGQIVVSRTTQELVGADLQFADLGEHRLRDLAEPERVFQLCHPSLPAVFPPLRSLDAYPTNLPVQSTAFVGRHDEMAQVQKALEEFRLVTLTGVGGVGKTRLALQVAAEVLPLYPDGAWLIDLAGAADTGSIEESAAAVLGTAQQSGKSVRQTLLSFLSNKRLLLLFDNCEHILDEVAHLLDDVLRGAPEVTVLGTSREALRVDGERVMSVPSLDVPGGALTIEALAGTDAVRLFVERARAARAGFVLNSDNAEAVVQLCRRLDGIPLAIELAAARVRSMAPGEIAARLDQRFRLLTGGSRTAANRHQTLRRAIDWSYDLLDQDERSLLGRLSVCAGGFDLAAAESIGSGGAIDALDVDDLLGRLVEKSLVAVIDRGDATRYKMLETVREYALERLETTGELAEVRSLHAGHYGDFAEQAGAGLKGPGERIWLLRVEEELDNLRAAVTWSVESEDAGTALSIIAALALQGLRIEPSVSSWADMVVTHDAAQHPDFPVALAVLGWWRQHEGRSAEAKRLLDEALVRLNERLTRPALTCRVMSPICGTTVEGDDLGLHTSRWLEAARANHDPYEASCALNLLGVSRLIKGDRTGLAKIEEALVEAHKSGSPSAIAYSSFSLALHLGASDIKRALELLDESLRSAAEAENDYAANFVMVTQGALASKQGNHLTAARMALNAAEQFHRQGHLDNEARQLVAVSASLAALGTCESAAVLRGWLETILVGKYLEAMTTTLNLSEDAVHAFLSLPERLGAERYDSLTAVGAAMTERQILEYASSQMPVDFGTSEH